MNDARQHIDKITFLLTLRRWQGSLVSLSAKLTGRVVLTTLPMILICNSAHAQQDPLPCLAPVVPMTALPDDVLAEYRTEIAVEFEAYFDALTAYITCLDTERARALAEARVATKVYSALLEIPPKPKDLP